MSVQYLIATATTPGAAGTREFLQRNGVPFHWVDLERDPLVRLLLRDRDLDDLRRPCVLFENGSMLEPPARYVLVRFFQRFHSGGEPTSPEEQQVYVETSRWRSELSERAGLPTRPRHEECDDLDLVGAELRRAAYRNRVLSSTMRQRNGTRIAWQRQAAERIAASRNHESGTSRGRGWRLAMTTGVADGAILPGMARSESTVWNASTDQAAADDGLAIDEGERRVCAWQAEQLHRLGLSWPVAQTFAPLVDWHEVAALVARGCAPELALEIAR
jgi:hypothetical protein